MTNILVETLFTEGYKSLNMEAVKGLVYWEEPMPDEAVYEIVYDLISKTDLSTSIEFLKEYAKYLPIMAILQHSKITDDLVSVKEIKEALSQSIATSAITDGENLVEMVGYLARNISKELLEEIYEEGLKIQSAIMNNKRNELMELEGEQFDQGSDSFAHTRHELRLANTGVVINNEDLKKFVQVYPDFFNLPTCAYQDTGITLEELHQENFIRYITHEDIESTKKTIQAEEDEGYISERDSVQMFIMLSDLNTSMAVMNRSALVNLLETMEDSEEVDIDEVEEVDEPQQEVRTMSAE